jgi:hypothetical protein
MNASLRDLATRAAAVPAPHLDAAAVVEAAESRLRRRRLAAVAAVTAAVIVIVATALLVAPGTRDAAPPAGPDQKKTTPDENHGPDTVWAGSVNRQLTYSVGATIHWGDKTIDVGQQANKGGLGRGDRSTTWTPPTTVLSSSSANPPSGTKLVGLPYGPAAVWFTDGSAPVRIGTTSGQGPGLWNRPHS